MLGAGTGGCTEPWNKTQALNTVSFSISQLCDISQVITSLPVPNRTAPYLLNGSINIYPKALLWGGTEALPFEAAAQNLAPCTHLLRHQLAWSSGEEDLTPVWLVWKGIVEEVAWSCLEG